MDSGSYILLARQSGLMREIQMVANNVANSGTTGFRQETVIFSEFIQTSDEGPSTSAGYGNVPHTSFMQGPLSPTGGTFDLAIEGEGFFLIETARGERLTRAGAFTQNAQGDLVTMSGDRLLDAGGAPVFVPPGAQSVSISTDGTISADGILLGQVGLVVANNPQSLIREAGVMFRADEGFEPGEGASILQGFVENSNVNAVSEIARLVEVQRAYEMGQSFLETEDERVRRAIEALTRTT